jgi:hypothetical protein
MDYKQSSISFTSWSGFGFCSWNPLNGSESDDGSENESAKKSESENGGFVFGSCLQPV